MDRYINKEILRKIGERKSTTILDPKSIKREK